MRTKLSFLIALLSITTIVWAENPEAINVEEFTGNIFSQRLNEVEKITFSDDETKMTLQTFDDNVTTTPITDIKQITFGEYLISTFTKSVAQDAAFSIYGNEQIRIECADGIRNVRIFGVNGQMLYSTATDHRPTQLNISTSVLTRGVCIVVVESTKASISQKIIIK